MSSRDILQPVSSNWRTSAWPTVARPILDKSGEKASKYQQAKSASDLTVHTLQSQSYCTWAGSHNTLDVIAMHGCTRNRNTFRVASLKLDQNDSMKSSMELHSQIKVEDPGSLAAIADNTIAIANGDGSISLYPLRDTSTRKYIEEPKKITTLVPYSKIAGVSSASSLSSPSSPSPSLSPSLSSLSTTLSSSGTEKRHIPLPRQALALDLTKSNSSSSSNSNQKLLAQIQDNLMIWDLNRPDAILTTFQTKTSTTKALKWCPLSSGNHFISRGSINGSVKIYDLRSRDPSQSVWDASFAHQGSVRDLAWNPLVPYWFATAGADSVIRVWDTRYGATPVREMADHSNSVNVISWSPTNVDLLVSGGADRRFKLWNLRVEPHYVIATLGRWDSSIVGVGWSHSRPNTPAFAVSATGAVQSVLLTPEFLLPLVPSLDGPQKDSLKRVERAIYCRNFSQGFQRAYQLAQQFLSENRISQANKLLNICYQRPPITDSFFEQKETKPSKLINDADQQITDQLSMNNTPTVIDAKPTISLDRFEKDLLFYCYYIPPNYPDHLWPSVDQKLMFSIEALKMSIELEQCIRDEDAAELVKIQPDVASFMKRDPSSVDIQLLFRLFSVLLPYDFLSSLELGFQLARVFSKNPTTFYGIANMLMFPTLYDTNTNRDSVYKGVLQSAKSVSPSGTPRREESGVPGSGSHKLYVGIQNAASSLNTEITSSFLADQLEFNYNFFKTIWGNNPKAAMDMFDQNTICLSATIWRIYLNMLIIHQQYDKLFIRGSRLGEKVKGFPFAEILSQLLSDAGPRLQKYLRDAASHGMSATSGRSSRMTDTNESNDESESIQAVNRLGKAGNMVLNILHNSDARYLPKTLVGILPSSLHQITVDLETSIREVVDEDNAIEETENSRISKALRTISNGLKETIGKKEPSGQFMEAINEYRMMIDQTSRTYIVSGAGVPSAPAPAKMGSRARLPSLSTFKGSEGSSTSIDSSRTRISIDKQGKKETDAKK